MITLKNKIVRNFVAGILSCVLVFSILVTIFVTLGYNEMFKKYDPTAQEIANLFKSLNDDESITEEQMWNQLDYKASQAKIDIYYYKPDKSIGYSAKFRDRSSPETKITRRYKVSNYDKNRSAGDLYVYYNIDQSPIYSLHKDFSKAIVYGLIISLIIGFVISLILSDIISEPIMSISDAALSIKDGNYDIDEDSSDIIELDDLRTNINYLSINLKKQEEIRKQYAQDISHELRTPLTNLQLYIEAIKDGVVEADENTMDVLLEDVNRLNGLVEGLKKTFDDSIEYFEINKDEFDLSLLIQRLVLGFLPNAEKNNITINQHLDENVIINSDRDKFTQILQNLITNAIKAIGGNGVIDIYLKDKGDKVTIKVSDNGIGIPKDKIDRIFERFYRIEDARNTKENGHGLGLSITKNFVEALGGKIKVESILDEGTTFTLTFTK